RVGRIPHERAGEGVERDRELRSAEGGREDRAVGETRRALESAGRARDRGGRLPRQLPGTRAASRPHRVVGPVLAARTDQHGNARSVRDDVGRRAEVEVLEFTVRMRLEGPYRI